MPVGVVLVSFIVIVSVVSTIVPEMLPVLILTVNVSESSVTKSFPGVTLKFPALLVITKLPLAILKSPEDETVQYNVVASSTLVVATFIVNALPSSTLSVAGVAVYVGKIIGVVLVSLIVILLVVSKTVPLILSDLILTVNVSAPSVVLSAVGVTVKLPVLLVIVKLPLDVPKSDALLAVQYKTVASSTFVVETFIVSGDPSSTLLVAGVTVYVGTTSCGGK